MLTVLLVFVLGTCMSLVTFVIILETLVLQYHIKQ
jgi:hypothetical protein